LFYYRSVTWTVQTYNPGTGAWTSVGSATRGMSHQAWTVDSLPVNIPSGATKVRVYFQAYDTNGSVYAAGSPSYNYTQNTVASNGASASAEVLGPASPPFVPTAIESASANLTAGAYSTPAGWEIYAVNYSTQWDHNEFAPSYSGSTLAYTNANYVYHVHPSPYYQTFNATVSTGDIATASYDPNFWTAMCAHYAGSSWHGKTTLHDPTATVKLRQLILGSAAALNSFRFDSFAWAVAGSSAIATGSLNWIAVGD